MIEVTEAQMFAEACQALGESIVRERILSAELDRMAAAQTEATVANQP